MRPISCVSGTRAQTQSRRQPGADRCFVGRRATEHVAGTAELPKPLLDAEHLHLVGARPAIRPGRGAAQQKCGRHGGLQLASQFIGQPGAEAVFRHAERAGDPAEPSPGKLPQGIAHGVAHRQRAGQDGAGHRDAQQDAEVRPPVKAQTAPQQALLADDGALGGR